MEFPSALVADEETRAGRMLKHGDVRVTVTDFESSDHITIRFKAMADNRPAQNGERPHPDANRNWVRVPLKEATHVFIEVPSAGGDFPDKVGTYYPRTSRFFPARDSDPARVEAAKRAAWWLSGHRADQRDELTAGFQYHEESNCGACGRVLTDPESIERGIGPECFGKQTDSHHQVKQHQGHLLSAKEQESVIEILDLIADLTENARAELVGQLQTGPIRW